MKRLILYLVLFICSSSYSQKRLSQEAINDVVNRASLYFGFEQNDKFRSMVNKYISTFNRSGSSAVMADLRKDLKGREDVYIFISRASANRESAVKTLTAMSVKAKNVQEIADYFFPKQVSKQEAIAEIPEKATPAEEEFSVKEILKPIEWKEPSKKFFDGSKTFCDSSGKWYYTFTIMKSNVLLIKYPGQPTGNANKNTATVTTKAVINGEHIVSARNTPTNYKYENNLLYEKADDGGVWNQYRECPGQ